MDRLAKFLFQLLSCSSMKRNVKISKVSLKAAGHSLEADVSQSHLWIESKGSERIRDVKSQVAQFSR